MNAMLPKTPASMEMAEATDCDAERRLIDGLREGDEDAFAALVKEYGGRMYAVARRFLACEEDRADAVQDAFLSAIRALDQFNGSSSLGTWLHRVVVNACLMKLRSQARRPTVSIEDLLPTFDATGHHARPVRAWEDDGWTRLSKEESRAHVRACIDQLPEQHRTVLMLRDIEELDTDQAAAILGINRGAVKTRLHRARQALRTLLDRDDQRPDG